MQSIRNEMIRKGLLKPQTSFLKDARKLLDRFDASSARIAKLDNVLKLEIDAERDAARKADEVADRKLEKAATYYPHMLIQNGNHKDVSNANFTKPVATTQATGIRKPVNNYDLPITKKQKSILRRIAQKNLSLEERKKSQEAFDLSRYLQEKEHNRLQRIQAAKITLQKNKKKKKEKRVWINDPNKSSSMFGGVKYSYVRVFQGGLPGLGKSK